MQRKKKKFIWIILCILSSILLSCYFEKSYYQYINKLETKIINENDNVLSANVLYDEGNWGEKKLEILISFKDNQQMLLSHVGCVQNYIIIRGINGYQLIRYDKNLFDDSISISSNFIIDLPEREKDIINNINQVIQDFDKMAIYMENLEDIETDKYKNKSIDWFWSEEANLEKKIIGNFERIEVKTSVRVYSYEPYLEKKKKWRGEVSTN